MSKLKGEICQYDIDCTGIYSCCMETFEKDKVWVCDVNTSDKCERT